MSEACLAKTLKFTPARETVAPSGALAPGATPSTVITGSRPPSFDGHGGRARPCVRRAAPDRSTTGVRRPSRAPPCHPCSRSAGAAFDRAARILEDFLSSRYPSRVLTVPLSSPGELPATLACHRSPAALLQRIRFPLDPRVPTKLQTQRRWTGPEFANRVRHCAVAPAIRRDRVTEH